MVVMEVLSMLKEKLDNTNFLGNVPTRPAVNLSRSISLIDTDSMQYAPKAFTQASIENYGNQNAAVINQDVNIIGSFTAGAQFIQTTDNNVTENGGIVVINKTVSDKTADALLYNGYCVLDGDI